jgi:hypothetical protein
LTVLVVIDSPRAKGYYGGVVAAPVFKRVAEAALRHLGVPPTVNPVPPVLVARHGEPDPERPSPRRAAAVLNAGVHVARDGLMPDLRGLSGREALRIAARLGLTTHLRGRGLVAEQKPAPGSPVERGVGCELVLRRDGAASDVDLRKGATP